MSRLLTNLLIYQYNTTTKSKKNKGQVASVFTGVPGVCGTHSFGLVLYEHAQ